MRIKDALTGIVAIGAVGGVVGAGLIMSPSDVDVRDNEIFEPAAATLHMVCHGGALGTIDGGIDAEDVDQANSGAAYAFALDTASVSWFAFATGSEATIDGSLSGDLRGESPLGLPEVSGILSADGSSPQQSKIAGSTTHTGMSGDMRGLAVNPCQWASNSVWLVGSSSDLANYNRLVVSNPGLTTITAEIDGFSSTGPLDLGSNAVINIPARSQQVVNLDGLLAADPRIALRVSTSSGRVSATLQSNALDGFDPAGISFVNASDDGSNIVVPGVVIPGQATEAAATQSSSLAAENTSVSIRVVNPAAEDVTASIYTLSGNGRELLSGGEGVTLAPMSVLDLSLAGLAPGDYSIEVEASGTVSAGVVMAEADTEAGLDYAWLSAQPMISRGGAAFDADIARLIISGSAGALVTWNAYDASGTSIGTGDAVVGAELAEDVQATTGVDLPQETAFVWMESDQPVYGAVSLRTLLAQGYGIDTVALTSAITETSRVPVAVTP